MLKTVSKQLRTPICAHMGQGMLAGELLVVSGNLIFVRYFRNKLVARVEGSDLGKQKSSGVYFSAL